MAAPTALTRWLRSRWERFDAPARLAGIDLARGLAVIGMLAAHLLVIEPFDLGDPGTWTDVANGRSSILFATLAGVSIALMTGGPRPLGGAARVRASARIAVRAAALWALGLALLLLGVPVFVILPAYAILFLLTLPFLGLRARTLFVIAGAAAVGMPVVQVWLDASPFWSSPAGAEVGAMIGWAYPFPTWIAFVLAGVAVGRCDLRRGGVAGMLLASGAGLAAVGYGFAAASPWTDEGTFAGALLTARAHSSGVFEAIGSGGFALAVIGACLLACRTPLRWPTVPLRAVGSMPLTAYTAQLVGWAVAATVIVGDRGDLGGFRAVEPFWPLTLAVVGGCCAWTFLVGRGPLESALDRLARWMVPDPDVRRAVDRLEG